MDIFRGLLGIVCEVASRQNGYYTYQQSTIQVWAPYFLFQRYLNGTIVDWGGVGQVYELD